jgi:hypothetical protein
MHQQVKERRVGFPQNGAIFHADPSKIDGKRPQLRLLFDSSVCNGLKIIRTASPKSLQQHLQQRFVGKVRR